MVSRSDSRKTLIRIVAGFAVLFGVLTIFSGGIALFADQGVRGLFGDVVRFVLLFNFASGFAYVLAGAGLWYRKRWAARTSVFIFVAILCVFALLAQHILSGGAFEMRTILAMTFRAISWLLISIVAIKQIGWNSKKAAN
jgi:hypothetical protein